MGTPATVVTPPAHWYSTFLHFFHHLGVYVSDTFVALFGRDSAHTFAVGAESLLRSDLGQIALIAVQEVENMASGAEKKAAALSKIASEATKMGLQVKDSMLNLLVELAVSRLKGVFGSGPTP